MQEQNTTHAILEWFDYTAKDKNVFLVQPSVEIRNGNTIVSVAGLLAEAYIITPQEEITYLLHTIEKHKHIIYHAILVIDAHLLTPKQVDQLRYLADNGYAVHCYGLKTNMSVTLFEGSKRLLEVCEELEQIPTTCNCGESADVCAHFINGVVTMEPVMSKDIQYKPMCHKCFRNAIAQKRFKKGEMSNIATIKDYIYDSRQEQYAQMIRMQQLLHELKRPENIHLRYKLKQWIQESQSYTWGRREYDSTDSEEVLRLRYVLNHVCPNLIHLHSIPVAYFNCVNDPVFMRKLFEYNYEHSQLSYVDMDGKLHPGFNYTEEEWDALVQFAEQLQ